MKKKLLFFAGALLIHLGVNAQDVVINKVFNSNASSPSTGSNDVVELLVLKDKLDMRGMYIKDVSSAAVGSTTFTDGGKIMFNRIDYWSSLRSGTTIVLRRSPSGTFTPDMDASDRTIDLKLETTDYFLNLGGTFALGSYDLIFIKAAAKTEAEQTTTAVGFDNLIHAFLPVVSSGIQAAFNNLTGPDGTKASSRKLGGSFILPTNGFIAPTNPTMTVADYNGVSTVTNPLLVSSTAEPAYGVGESGNNAAFITYLRSAPVIEKIFTDAAPASTSIEFTVEFSKDVTGVDVSDFVLTTAESAVGTITGISGSGSVYKVTVSGLSGEGIVRLDKKASGTGIMAGTTPILEGFAFELGVPYVVGKVPPVVVKEQSLGIRVTAQPGEAVGTVKATLVGQGAVDGWAIVEGNDDNAFAIDAAGLITVADNSAFDFTKKAVHKIWVTAGNGNKISVKESVEVRLMLPPLAPQIIGSYNSLVPTRSPRLRGSLNLSAELKTGVIETFKVTLYVDGAPVSTDIPVTTLGTWSYKLTNELSVGSHSYYATFNDAGSNSDASPAVSVKSIEAGFGVTVHNVITPNADGKNDTWKVENIEIYNDNEVMVFNKMGKVVYQKKQYQQDWDGSSEGKMLETGTYYYRVSLGKGMEPLKGVLTIVRDK